MFIKNIIYKRLGAPRALGSVRAHLNAIGCVLVLLAGSVVAQVPDWPEETLESKFEESVEDNAQEAVEEKIDAYIDELVVGPGIRNFENKIEEKVEDSVADALEEELEGEIADAIEGDIEAGITENVEITVEERVEDEIVESLEDDLQENVEADVEEQLEESIEVKIVENIEQEVEQTVEESLEQGVDGEIALAIEDNIENKIDQILEQFESDIEGDEGRIEKGRWLVMAEPEAFRKLAEEGYLFTTVTDLPGMGVRLAEVAAPSSFDISEVRQGVIDVVGKDRAQVDLNHIYTAGRLVNSPLEHGITPRSAISFPADTLQMVLRIGMIDSAVDVTHPSLEKAAIHTRSFLSEDSEATNFHGTAIASIIVADSLPYQGLAPNSELYAASVFENDRETGEIASTVSLVRALDWLIVSKVDVVNISLAGPPNRLLESALNRATSRGLIILAAAGNGGPVAEPMYPAAYDSVVAVTAVDKMRHIFRLANRGKYLDLAAPGVDLLHAKAGGGFAASSGTSFAVPFAATAAARIRQLHPDQDVLRELYESADDLGSPGGDEIFGYGLLCPQRPQVSRREQR